MSQAITSFSGEHRFLSNFFPSRIRWAGIDWPTVEHAYQGAKTLNPAGRALIATAPTPGKAKRLGQKLALREDWDDLRVGTMRELLALKFSIPELSRLLVATGTAELVEGNTWGDRFWGVCGGEGENMLGRLLMEIRAWRIAAEVLS